MQHTMFAEETLNSQVVVENNAPKVEILKVKRNPKYLPVDVLRDSIRGMFQSFSQYREYVTKHNLTKHGYPLNCRSAYGYDLSIDEFLGNPEGTYLEFSKKRIREHRPWILGNHVRSTNATRNKQQALRTEIDNYQDAKKLAEVRSANIAEIMFDKLNNELSIHDVCKYLLSRDMKGTVRSILSEGKITLEDSRIVSDMLIEYYETKQRVSVK